MDNEIMVSILCATYNHQDYIAEALDSFIMQKTNFKFEVIINDDASTDGTADIIREYEQKYPDIIKPIYQTENQYSKGVKIIRDINLPRAKGKYIAICEGDDYWTDENKLQIQFDFMEDNPEYTMCMCGNEFVSAVDSNAKTICRFNNESCDMSFVDCLYCFAFPQTASMFFRADVLRKSYTCGFPLSPYYGDYVWRLYGAYEGKVWYIDRVMTAYRRFVPNSWSESNKKSKNDTHVRFTAFTYYDELDKYTEYKYHKEIVKLKYKYAFNCNLTKEDYKKLYDSPDYQLAEKSEHTKIFLGRYFPFVLKFALKLKRKQVHNKHKKEATVKTEVHETFFKKTKKED